MQVSMNFLEDLFEKKFCKDLNQNVSDLWVEEL